MNDITYILGAGASFQAMPLVNNFCSRFKIFQNFIGEQFAFPGFGSDCVSFGNEIKAHSTFDTFFKKLFHQNKLEDIDKYKSVLLFYFVFEHLFTYEELGYDEELGKTNNKLHKLDPRYEALIAGLLKPIKGKVDFYKNVNFITWNYDTNLLNSLRNFISPDVPLYDFITENYHDGYFQINSQIRVYHLNGFISHPILNEIENYNSIQVFSEFLKSYGQMELKQYIKNIHFAWEQEEKIFKDMSEIILESDNVVSIGYSFPLYNRIFDSYLFNYKNLKGRHLYIQNLETKPIKNILRSDFNIFRDQVVDGEIPITYSENCLSFLIPINIFY
jgi:hypothetical protein